MNRGITGGVLSSAVFLNTVFLTKRRYYHRQPPEKSWRQALMKGIMEKLEVGQNIFKRVGVDHRWVGFFFIIFGVVCLWSLVNK